MNYSEAIERARAGMRISRWLWNDNTCVKLFAGSYVKVTAWEDGSEDRIREYLPNDEDLGACDWYRVDGK